MTRRAPGRSHQAKALRRTPGSGGWLRVGAWVMAFASACSSSAGSSSGGDASDANPEDGRLGAAEPGSANPTGSDSAAGPNGSSGETGDNGDGGEGAVDGAAGADGGLLAGPPAVGPGGTACPSLTGPADRAYPRWPIPNPSAAHLPHPFRYTDHGDGTVSDEVTGLLWQKVVSGSATFAAAPAYCASLTLPVPPGSTWQVPTRIQLLSIVDYTTGAAVDAPFLASGQPPGGKYTWTSTPWVVSQIATKPQDAWMVNFGGGGGLASNAAAQTATEWIRCVAAPPVTPLPYPHYVQVDTGEAGDVETGLVWAQASHNTVLTQSAALAYCAGLALNGHTWRLPSVDELASLVDDNPAIARVSPAIDPCVFSDTSPSTYYISSSTWGATPWGLNYEDGFDFNTEPPLPDAGQGVPGGFVKCVR